MSSKPSTLLSALLFLSASLSFPTLEYLSSLSFTPTYSYTSDFISDLGVPYSYPHPLTGIPTRSRGATLMNANFILGGALYVLAQFFGESGGGAAAANRLGLGMWNARKILGGVYALGLVLVAVVPGGPEEIEDGSMGFHMLGATLAIMGGNLASVVNGLAGKGIYRVGSVALGGFGLLATMYFSAMQTELDKGLLERFAVYPIHAWEAWTALMLLGSLLREDATAVKRD